MKVIFSHGKESGPWGFKIKRLSSIAQKLGCDVESIDYTDLMDPDQRVERLFSFLKNDHEDFILVGSSMGGYVSLVVSEAIEARAVFLMAPALYIPGYGVQQHHSRSSHIEIVHGWSDDLIPVENSIQYAKQADCTLHVISGDHALNSSVEEVERLFQAFLVQVLADQG